MLEGCSKVYKSSNMCVKNKTSVFVGQMCETILNLGIFGSNLYKNAFFNLFYESWVYTVKSQIKT